MLFAWATLFTGLENFTKSICDHGVAGKERKHLRQHQPFAYISHKFLTTRLLTILEKASHSPISKLVFIKAYGISKAFVNENCLSANPSILELLFENWTGKFIQN